MSVSRIANVLNKAAETPELAAVKTQQPMSSEPTSSKPAEQDHQVLPFRPRGSSRMAARRVDIGHGGPAEPRGQADDLSRYERVRDPPDDFRHRMLANLAAIAFTIALMAVGIWLVISIAGLRTTQDCILMGRRDCAPISAPHF